MALFAIQIDFVNKYAGQVPFGDEWNYISVIAGRQPASLAWLWEQDYESREPIPKLIHLTLGRLSGCDLRLPRFLGAALLAASALMFMLTARAIRGGTVAADAFFPLALMHLGHVRPLLHNHYLVYSLTTMVLTLFLTTIVISPSAPGPRRTILAGLCLACLPLCGAGGAVMTPFFSLWLASIAIWKRPAPGKGLLHLLFAVLAVCITGLCFAGYHRPPDVPPSAGLLAIATVAGRFIAMSIGPVACSFWPIALLFVAGVFLASFWPLGRAWERNPEERLRITGLLLIPVAMLALAISVGYGRSGYADGRDYIGLMPQYSTAGAPLLCGIYLIWEIAAADGGTIRILRFPTPAPSLVRFVRALLFIVMTILLPFNTRIGLGSGKAIRELESKLTRDIRTGLSPREVAARHWPWFYCSEKRMALRMEILKQVSAGPYRPAPGRR
jgi:hypothetical protein